MGMRMSIEVLANRSHDEVLLLVAELGVDRQGEGLAGGRLGDRKIARLVAQRGEAGLEMKRYRVVDLGADLPRRQKVAQGIAERRGHADDVLVEDVEITVSLRAEGRSGAVSPMRFKRDSDSARRPRGACASSRRDDPA